MSISPQDHKRECPSATNSDGPPGKARRSNASDLRPFTVVLTGGPCSGKSSVLAVLKRRLSVRGFQVLTVPENATHLLANSDGFQPEWAGTQSQVDMQRIFLDFQLDQERAFREFAALNSKPAVLLLDRSTLDSKVFLSDEQFEKVLDHHTKPKLAEDELLKRYDLVIHMVTCAQGNEGKYEWGPGSNNPGRYHSPEQARDQDRRCLEVYKPHPQLRVVPSLHNFEDKVDAALKYLDDALHIDGLAGKRKRVCVQVGDIPDEVMQSANAYVASSTYLDNDMHHCLRRIMKTTVQDWKDRFGAQGSEAGKNLPVSGLSEDAMYEKRIQVTPPDGQGYLTRKMISEYEYASELELAKSRSVHKFGLCFLIKHSYYELFFFPSQDGQLVLDLGESAPLPSWVKPLPEDTSSCTAAPASDKRRVSSTGQVEAHAACGPADGVLSAPSPATSPTSVPGMQDDKAVVGSQTKKLGGRALRRHTTEEAASALYMQKTGGA
eukprot:TRINITY_DN5021_c0_g1_i1.p1 TRINITY_DN5021_c0_g1~~TRINITY_DN5021_c0_g1_i1.p1  ORF type:complete len:493 (+),score=123.44 TRINITY_DN5021_c0_g1_i1:67-1545(+)